MPAQGVSVKCYAVIEAIVARVGNTVLKAIVEKDSGALTAQLILVSVHTTCHGWQVQRDII